MADEYMSDAFVYMRERRLSYPVFDVDNHMYENRDALTKFLPPELDGIIKYVDIAGRTKLAIKDKITEYIPNPTFNKVAPPGRADPQQRRAIPSPDAFFDPEPRKVLMKDMGIDKALMWPTLASAVEERLADDPDAVQAVIRALNRWMLEHWTFNYDDVMYPTPIISLSVLDDALAELEFVVENGAKVFLLRSAPVPTWKGRRSFALPEFDPFWAAVQEAGILVGMHSGDPGYHRYINEWNGTDTEMLPFGRGGYPAFVALMSEKSVIIDAMASIIGHGLATRFPKLRFAPTEYATGQWLRDWYNKLGRTYESSPVLFDEDPQVVFRRNIFIHCFRDPDPAELARLIGADNVMFGSDFPHPEGLADPLAYSEVVESTMSKEDAAKVMGGNLARIMRV